MKKATLWSSLKAQGGPAAYWGEDRKSSVPQHPESLSARYGLLLLKPTRVMGLHVKL